ncbi:hypothetical protein BS17DRAFT_175005 [Gyrodon lividus]|nr:hypothetical protein BS17DRAFT_175005 [Gyrodon lividus]
MSRRPWQGTTDIYPSRPTMTWTSLFLWNIISFLVGGFGFSPTCIVYLSKLSIQYCTQLAVLGVVRKFQHLNSRLIGLRRHQVKNLNMIALVQAAQGCSTSHGSPSPLTRPWAFCWLGFLPTLKLFGILTSQ